MALLFLGSVLCAQPAQALPVDTESRTLGPEIAYLEDVSGLWQIADIRGAELASKFQTWPSEKGPINLGMTSSAYWFRIQLERSPQTPASWVLEIPYFQLQTLDFYAPDQPRIRTGAQHPLSSRPYLHRFFAFPVELSTEPRTFYLRVVNTHSMTLPLVLWQEKAFRDHVQSTFIVQSLYFGGLLALLIYNLFIFLSLRDPRFLLYTLYSGALGLGMLAGNGFGQMFLWSSRPEFDSVAQSFFLGLAAGFGMLFGDVFLQARQHMPLLSRLLRATACWFCLLAGLLLLSNLWDAIPSGPLVMTTFLSTVPAGLLVVYASVGVWFNGQKGVRFFLLAWSTLWMGAFIATLRAFGWIPTTTFTAYSLQISSAAEMLMLSLALADIMHSERQTRERAQRETLLAQQKLLENAKTAEERLERAVQERTVQLQQALDNEVQLLKQYMRFGALISHEFRNPLGIIDSQLSLMRKEHEKGQLQLEKRLNTMSGATRRLVSMFDKWLQGDRLNHALQSMKPVSISLSAWLSEIVDAQSQYHETHRLELSSGNITPPVSADEDLLEIAVLNLIDNACKYSAPGSSVRIELRQRPNQVGIAIIDQGQGISPEHQSAILEDYYRVTPEGPVRGMGLGLPFVLRIAQMHRAQLEVQSEPGQGSTFCLWLPAEMK